MKRGKAHLPEPARGKKAVERWFARGGLLWMVITLALSACGGQAGAAVTAGAEPVPFPTATHAASMEETQTTAPTAAPRPSPTAAPEPSPTPLAPSVWVPGYLPEMLEAGLAFAPGVERAAREDEALARVVLQAGGSAEGGAALAEWVFALVAPFPTVADEVSLADVTAVWRGSPPEGLPFEGLLVEKRTRALLEEAWGPPSALVKTSLPNRMLDRAWKEKTLWALAPFEHLEPRWKVVAVDGQSPLRKGFDPTAYGLTFRFALEGDPALAAVEGSVLRNYDPSKLTTVMLTGVTALVRGTGAMMEIYGMEFPAEFTGDTLREADILHINNEVPFWKTCPEPYNWEGLVFCSRTKYIQLLEAIGTDVVELAGDHFQDWGKEAMLFTLDLYKERGWPVYGGGANKQEAQQAARFEHNGNRIAFIGCNAKPPGYAGASDTHPGAVHCDFEQLAQEIGRQRADGYLPVVTFQHLEYYSYNSHPILEADFKLAAEAGAVVVSGSQAHQPHAMTFALDEAGQASFLHYGLGNLFFDQKIFGLETSQAFLDRHIFYDGRYIGTELLTIMFVDHARARFMTPEEREFLLTTIFKASGW